jgi:hypothetical protein
MTLSLLQMANLWLAIAPVMGASLLVIFIALRRLNNSKG